MHKLFLVSILLCAAACTSPDVQPRSTGETGAGTTADPGATDVDSIVTDSEPEAPASECEPLEYSPDVSACECDPDEKGQCGLGLDCIPWGATGKGACLAKCDGGTNEIGGGYITTCQAGGRDVKCYYPHGPAGDPYCPACAACDQVKPNTLVCG